jgi:hypothetical protein
VGALRKPLPVRLIIGLLSRSIAEANVAKGRLEQQFGPVDLELPPIPFTWTNYYLQEIGEAPFRSFLAFETLIDRESIPSIKLWTNELELNIFDGVRFVNLDPGYMTLGQFFLATTKDQRQRVYIREGIFVEPTLYFQNGNWYPFDWTYRDYQSDEYRQYFSKVRERLAYQHKMNKPYSAR